MRYTRVNPLRVLSMIYPFDFECVCTEISLKLQENQAWKPRSNEHGVNAKEQVACYYLLIITIRLAIDVFALKCDWRKRRRERCFGNFLNNYFAYIYIFLMKIILK